MSLFVRVVFPLPLDRPFVYAVPDRLRERARPGCRVLAPLGKKTQSGFIVAASPQPPPPGMQVKDIAEVLDDKPFWDERYLSFTEVLSAEYHSSWGEILQASLPPSLALKTKVTVTLTDAGREALEKKKLGPRERTLAGLLLEQAKGRSPLFLQRKAGLKSAPAMISRMAKKGLVAVLETRLPPPRARKEILEERISQLRLDFPGTKRPEGALSPVEKALDEGRSGAFYLYGPRPALEAAYRGLVQRTMGNSGKTLFLVPEVALTRELIADFEAEFGGKAVVFHGRMTEKQKDSAWRGLRSRKTALIAGTRSALFLDPGALRLIVVADEHEDSYFQSESPSYDARRGAWLRAHSEGAVVVFGSPRPSVEAFYGAERAGSLIELGGSDEKTPVSWIDHGAETPLVSRDLERKIQACLRREEPAVLFLNRRGYASSLVCAACGRVPRCRRCDIPLVYHKKEDELICHYCNASLRAGAGCPACGGRLALRRGAGTQALEEELKNLFPGVPVARFDADTAAGREEREAIIRRFAQGRTPLLVGTQLLAYQPGVPRVRLVGVLSPETLLGFSDYRVGQKTFQAVARMTELSEPGPGSEVVVQTPVPVHYSIRAAASRDFTAFYAQEIHFRRIMNYPPLTALAEVTLQGRDLRSLGTRSREFRALLRKFEPELEVLGPAFAAVVRVKDVSRVQVILKARSRETIVRALGEALPCVRLRKSIVFSYSPFGGE
jgi:primosomal protein N' (replication factor Y)